MNNIAHPCALSINHGPHAFHQKGRVPHHPGSCILGIIIIGPRIDQTQLKLMEEKSIGGRHILGPPLFQVMKASNASYPSLIVDSQLAVLVLVNRQVLVEQDLPQHLEHNVSTSLERTTNSLFIPLKVWDTKSCS